MPSISEILKSRIGSKPNTSKAFIASKLGVSEKTVENYINGKRNPKPDALVQLSQLLDFSLDEMSEQNVRDLTDGNSNLTLVHRDIEVVNGDKQDHFLKQRQQQKLLDKWHNGQLHRNIPG
jgi:transcriptional regulator with XRE-family HTH domain